MDFLQRGEDPVHQLRAGPARAGPAAAHPHRHLRGDARRVDHVRPGRLLTERVRGHPLHQPRGRGRCARHQRDRSQGGGNYDRKKCSLGRWQ